jgi:hypothetical protein
MNNGMQFYRLNKVAPGFDFRTLSSSYTSRLCLKRTSLPYQLHLHTLLKKVLVIYSKLFLYQWECPLGINNKPLGLVTKSNFASICLSYRTVLPESLWSRMCSVADKGDTTRKHEWPLKQMSAITITDSHNKAAVQQHTYVGGGGRGDIAPTHSRPRH